MLKRSFMILCIHIFCVLFMGCGTIKPEFEVMESEYESQREELDENNTDMPEKIDDSEIVKMEEVKTISVAQAFSSVLLNETEMFCTIREQGEYTEVIKRNEGYGLLKEMPYAKSKEVAYFAVVDLDGDMIPEVVVELENYNYIVLRYREGQIRGMSVSNKEMGSFKKNGLFEQIDGCDAGKIGKLHYIGDVMVPDEALRMADQYTFYLYDMISDEEIWREIEDSYYESPDVEWHDYTEKAVHEWITENTLFTEISAETTKNSNIRQEYLDSLSYLIDITYDFWLKNDEEYRKAAVAYYDGCQKEMDKIYELCQEKLSGEELEELQNEQQDWRENFELRLEKELSRYELENMEGLLEIEDRSAYFRYGEIMLRRALRLVDIYYGFNNCIF